VRNAAVSFVKGPISPAPRFAFKGSAEDRSRATECLALAAMAEAGPSDIGQRAVIQVVLNRVRHPAFAKSVCGVVFEGSARATGCQFTFTCDGSLTRQYSDSAWLQARIRAGEALGGYVFKPVGLATHYHTDWVYPYWSPELDKVARVDTHLFFRWPGYWGSGAVARITYRGGEPDFARLVGSPGDAATDAAAAALPKAALPSDTPTLASGSVMLRDPTGKANFILLAAGGTPAQAIASARALCNRGGTCRVYGWLDGAEIPAALPLPRGARAALQFSYARDPGGAEIALYNCDNFPGLPREQCIPRAR
jgi:hypothetical protein